MLKLIAHVFLLADLLFNSRLYRLFGVAAFQPVLLGLGAAIMFGAFAWGVFRGYLTTSVLAIILLGLMVHQMYFFSSQSLVLPQVNSIFQYLWLLSFVVFYALFSEGLFASASRFLVGYSSAYVMLYVVLSLATILNVIPSDFFAPLTLLDLERGARVFIYAPAAAYAWFFWLQKCRVDRNRLNVAMCFLCAAAIGLSLSRVYILVVSLVTCFMLCKLSPRSLGYVCAVLFFAAAGFNLFGLVDVDWNPYSEFAGDSSGSYRIIEYELARFFIDKNPLFGFGLAPTPKAAGLVLTNDFFSASDIGPTGVWFDWGITGLLLFIIGSAITFIPYKPGPEADFNAPLYLTACVLGLYGCLAPLIFTGGATFFGFIFAGWLYSRKQRIRGRP